MNVPTTRILMIHLEALGAVLRSTALLPAIRRKFPGCHITWVTKKPAEQLLLNNPFIDRLMTTSPEDLLQLSAIEFDVALVIDKGLASAGVLKQTHAELIFGFSVDPHSGAVLPATPAAQELWEIGLSNTKKFFENTKPETQLNHEALDLGKWLRDEYVVNLSAQERKSAELRRAEWLGTSVYPVTNPAVLVGINTGCSTVLPYKKLSIEMHRELIARIHEIPGCRVVLLGGKEDSERNEKIAAGFSTGSANTSVVIQSPTQLGLRDGLASTAACDLIVTGDSLGMHMAIGLRKWTVAWFGPTCEQEIDLYGRGVKIVTQASCSPCWKRSCPKEKSSAGPGEPMCYDLVSVDALINGIRLGLQSESENHQSLDARP